MTIRSKGLRLQANTELAQIVSCRTYKAKALGVNSHWGNFFFFLVSCDSVEFYRMHLHLGKTQLEHIILGNYTTFGLSHDSVNLVNSVKVIENSNWLLMENNHLQMTIAKTPIEVQ